MTGLTYVPGDAWTSTGYKNGPLRVIEWVGTQMKWSCRCGAHGLEKDTGTAMQAAHRHYDASHEGRPVTSAVVYAPFIESVFNIFYTLLRGRACEGLRVTIDHRAGDPAAEELGGSFRIAVADAIGVVVHRDIPTSDMVALWKQMNEPSSTLTESRDRRRAFNHRLTDAIDGALHELKGATR